MQSISFEGVYKNGLKDGVFTFRKVSFLFLLFEFDFFYLFRLINFSALFQNGLIWQDEREKSQRISKRSRRDEDEEGSDNDGIVVYRDGQPISSSHPDLFQFLNTAPWCIDSSI